ncbi:hypothetical protein LY76DRAFT_324841 [Colletotrichum caudatum]|nr:hypothetical protein LY76DRAFT_324841 [Colletotrichum caudatum]
MYDYIDMKSAAMTCTPFSLSLPPAVPRRYVPIMLAWAGLGLSFAGTVNRRVRLHMTAEGHDPVRWRCAGPPRRHHLILFTTAREAERNARHRLSALRCFGLPSSFPFSSPCWTT